MNLLSQLKSKLKEAQAKDKESIAAGGTAKRLQAPAGRGVAVLYHENCMDGFCAAWLAWKKFSLATFIPMQYGDPLPAGLEDKEVYILDFSFKRDIIEELIKIAKKVVVLDHHKTAKAELEGEWDYDNVYIHFDMEKSGAELTQKYFKLDEKYNFLVDYTSDRDLWKWKRPDSREINAWIRSQPLDFEMWSTYEGLWQRNAHVFKPKIVGEGGAILRQLKQMVKSHVKHALTMNFSKNERVKVSFGHSPLGTGYIENCCEGLVVNCTSADLISDVAGELAEQSGTFGATYFIGEDKVTFSLRSRGEVDVSEVAGRLGGGGHKKAAGFSLTFEEFVTFLRVGRKLWI